MVINTVENDCLNQVDGNFPFFIYDCLIVISISWELILDSPKKNQNICVCYMYLHLKTLQ